MEIRGLTALATKRDQSAGQVYLVSDGAPVTWKEFFGYYAKMAGKPSIKSVPRWLAKVIALGMEITSKFIGRSPKITREAIRFLTHQARFSIEKAKRELGYQPRFSLEEGMKLTEQWLREAGYLPRENENRTNRIETQTCPGFATPFFLCHLLLPPEKPTLFFVSLT